MGKTVRHNYSEEEKAFIKNNVKGRRSSELTDMFNDKFGTRLKVTQIRGFKKNHGLTSGVNMQFKKGNVP